MKNPLYLLALGVNRTARCASRNWRINGILVIAGYDEKRLAPSERFLRSLEPVLQGGLEADDARVESGTGLR